MWASAVTALGVSPADAWKLTPSEFWIMMDMKSDDGGVLTDFDELSQEGVADFEADLRARGLID